MCANKNGIAAREIARKYKLTNKTAWFVAHRVRLAMENLPVAKPLRGTIVADETWIGGTPWRMNSETRRRWEGERQEPERITPGNRPNLHTAKTPVLSLVSVETGEVRSKVVTDISGPTLRKAIANQVVMSGSRLMTDEGLQYRQLGQEFLSHGTVNHKAGEYVRGAVTSNQAENFFSQLKRSLDGTHHHISKEHLPRYLAEFDFRYSTRRLTDTQRMQRLMGQTADRRLSYKRVTRS
jgi:hypothetical protein